MNEINEEPSGCSLIIQFLYHAYMTEQVYNNGTNANGTSVLPSSANSTQSLTPSNNKTANLDLQQATATEANPIASPLPAVSSLSSLNQSSEPKTKRIKVLRILAIKTAALLGWDILKFEKE